ncbi:hypothetical protein NDU88_003975 [Pleurodeles waltl]|uniref:Myb/SANT-like DNA-binding domain-containing protein n=1 Tax=Pleurodeles waltl TaxID=8319 RepID=A0AAV7LIJ4_PLEWA|nr:hypothetical protein NDU88_003975 [Pleurodeles waltl]
MVDEILKVEPQIFGAQIQHTPIARKMELRQTIVNKVNAVGDNPRMRDDIRKRWNDLRGKVSAYQKRAFWQTIAREVQTLGVYNRQSTHCRKRWEDLRGWARMTCKAQLGKSSQRGRGARQALTSLMRRILAVAYPDLNGRLKAAQQPQGGEYQHHGMPL